LTWKTNDRAVLTYKNMEEILASKPALAKIIDAWIAAAK